MWFYAPLVKFLSWILLQRLNVQIISAFSFDKLHNNRPLFPTEVGSAFALKINSLILLVNFKVIPSGHTIKIRNIFKRTVKPSNIRFNSWIKYVDRS